MTENVYIGVCNNVNNKNISFKSRIRPVSLTEFTKMSEPLYRTSFVKYPWTIKDSVTAADAFTMDIADCTAGGIVDTKNKKVFLFHICPEMPINQCMSDIAQHINGAFEGIHEGLRAFLTGSSEMFRDSVNNYNNIKNAILERKIPLTEFKGPKSKTHILYDSNKDEWIISNIDINTRMVNNELNNASLNQCFDNIHIDNGDVLSLQL